jgi:predicted transglutaminase-like cysteine proteinase
LRAFSRAPAQGGLFALYLGFQAIAPSSATAGSAALTSQRLAELQQVNTYVNGVITEVSDMENYGRADVWRIPTNGKGDCEDFALMKRQILLQRGWPASALTILVGTNAQGEAHAVLNVKTSQGDYILDNLRYDVVPAVQSGFTTYSRQTNRGFASATTGRMSSVPRAEFAIGAGSLLANAE